MWFISGFVVLVGSDQVDAMSKMPEKIISFVSIIYVLDILKIYKQLLSNVNEGNMYLLYHI
jgi:hypothetical protein